MPCHFALHATPLKQGSLKSPLSRNRIPKITSPVPSPPSCLQRSVPVARTQTHWWQRKGDVIKRLTTAAHFTAIINICTWARGRKCKQKIRAVGWEAGGRWFWLYLVPIYPKAHGVIDVGNQRVLCCINANMMCTHTQTQNKQLLPIMRILPLSFVARPGFRESYRCQIIDDELKRGSSELRSINAAFNQNGPTITCSSYNP